MRKQEPRTNISVPLFKVLISLFLAGTVFLIYWQTSGFNFVNFDDPVYVQTNPYIRQGITFDSISWAFRYVYACNWHPVTWISHMIDIELFGMKPGMHHLTNVFLHALNSILLFFLMERMTGALWKSAIVAALFALHPLHVESVAWISERKDVLSTLFWILTLSAYCWYARRKRLWRYVLTVFFFGLGLMAKPMLVTLPFVLLLLDFWPLQREELANQEVQGRGLFRLILEKVPFIVMAIGAGLETFYAQLIGGAVSNFERVSLLSRLQNAVTSYAAYLGKMIWPTHLAAFYPLTKQFNATTVISCALLLAAATVIVIVFSKRLPYLITGWFWYLGTLFPVIGIVQVGSQSMADRYTYIPLIGIFILITWGSADIFGRWRHSGKALGIFAVIVLTFLARTAWIQAGTWRDSETLFRHAIEINQENYLAHSSLGVALFYRGDIEGAIRHYEESLRLMPNYVNAHVNLGIALMVKKQYAEALAQFRQSLRIQPDYSEAHYNMGVVLSDLDKKDEAIKQYSQVLRINSCHENANNNLALLLEEKGDLDTAMHHFQKAIEVNPESVRARSNLADLLMRRGKLDEAMKQVNESLKIEPKNPHLYILAGDIFSRKKEKGRAVTAYRTALAISPGFLEAQERLE